MSSIPATVLPMNNNMLIQYGCTNKPPNEALMDIPFGRRFGAQPVVVVSPYYKGSGHSVGHYETIDRVYLDRFIVASDNSGNDYFVQWIAIGPAEGFTRILPIINEDGRMLLLAGYAEKLTRGTVSPAFEMLGGHAFEPSSTPSVIVSPFFEGADRSVGDPETINSIGPSQFSVYSGNFGSNYQVSWIALGSRGRLPLQDHFIIGDKLIRMGAKPKVNSTQETIELRGEAGDGPVFVSEPVVVISSMYRQSPARVDHAETIGFVADQSSVREQYFSVRSNLRHGRYSVPWIAIGDVA